MDLNIDLDVMGTQPGLFKLYTQIAFIFASSSTEAVAITSRIASGLDVLSTKIPWLSGQVVNTNTDPNGVPLYKVRSYRETPVLKVKDYTTDPSVPTLDQLKSAGYPMSMMAEQTWAPCPTLAALGFDLSKPSEEADRPAPVMLVQLSVIKGGVVLCINLQHNICDMMGQAAIIGWLAKASRGEELTDQELEMTRKSRKDMVTPFEGQLWDPGNLLDYQLLPASNSQPALPKDPQTSSTKQSWVYFHFTAASQAALKELATTTLPSEFQGYITTDDSLSAFIYQSVSRARQSRVPPTTDVTFARAVDARRYLNVPANYPGILQNMAYTTLKLSSLSTLPLGHVAAALRRGVDPETCDIAERTRALVTYLSQAPENVLKTSPTATLRPDVDIPFSSWTKVPASTFDFGFGPPVATRRPGFVPVESLMYAMPKDANGDVAVAMCLGHEDLGRLKTDEGWSQFAQFIG